MQKLLITSGDPVEASSLKTIFQQIMQAGVVQGMDLYVASNNTVGITAGTALTDSGVFISESEVMSLTIPQSVAPKEYTIVYSYVDSLDFGGGSASLQLITGLLNDNTFSNGVIVGWVKYAGGSLPLSSDMLISATKVRLEKPLELRQNNFKDVLAPFAGRWSKKSPVSGNQLTILDIYDTGLSAPVTEVSNTNAIQVTAEYLMPFAVPYGGAGQLLIDFSVSTGASVEFDILAQNGTVVVPTGLVTLFTNKAMSQVILSIPKSSALAQGSIMYIRALMKVNPMHNIKYKRFGISSFVEPI